MFDESKCVECLCDTCVYDYGADCCSVSCLCKNRQYGSCMDCKRQNRNNVVDSCCYYES